MKLEVIRVMDDEGQVVHPERDPALSGDELRRLFRVITLVRILDERMLRLQRQGRMGFYLSSLGEEATHIGAAHALRLSDWLFPAYREAGAALYRGYPLPTFMCQLFGNADDPVKGRQMPVHHSVRRINFVSVSSPVGSHIPHAVGAAWAAKISKKDDVDHRQDVVAVDEHAGQAVGDRLAGEGRGRRLRRARHRDRPAVVAAK